MNERLSWNDIKKNYPSQNVGLVDVETIGNSVSVKSAVVKYTDKTTPYEKLVEMAMDGSICLMYTTMDEDELVGVIG